MSKRKFRRPAPRSGQRIELTATEALAMAETMSNGEAAQMAIAAELMGMDYDEFLLELAREAKMGFDLGDGR